MTPAAQSPRPGWSTVQFRGVVLLLFALHVLFVGYVLRVPRPEAGRSRPPGLVWQAVDLGEVAAMEARPGMTPPTVFTGGRDVAFWDAAERRLPRTGYELAEWTPPVRWLENRGGRWLPQLPEPPRLPAARRSPPPALSVAAPPLPMLASTRLSLGEELRTRGLEASDAPPVGGPGEVTGDTVVEVMVDGRGVVLSARLAQGCGVRGNDEAAVAHARGLRFRRLPGVDRARELDPALVSRDGVRYRWSSASPAPAAAVPGLR